MEPPLETVLAQLELWNELAEAIEQGHHALLARDLACFQDCTEKQRTCCERLRAMHERQPGGAWVGWRCETETEVEELARAQQRVRYLGRRQGALLRRALQSVRMLRNLAGVNPYLAASGNGKARAAED